MLHFKKSNEHNQLFFWAVKFLEVSKSICVVHIPSTMNKTVFSLQSHKYLHQMTWQKVV